MENLLVKLIKVKDETHRDLANLGSYGDTMDDIIRRLLDEHERKKK